jgi:hypothetical protein
MRRFAAAGDEAPGKEARSFRPNPAPTAAATRPSSTGPPSTPGWRRSPPPRSPPSTPRPPASTRWGAAGRHVVRHRRGRGRLPAAGAPLRRRAAQLPLAEVLDKLRPWLESDAPRQARPEPQVRRPRAGQPRHRASRGIAHDTLLESYVLESDKSHDMDSLASATSASRHHHLRRSHRQGRQADRLRARSTSPAPPNTPPRTPTSPCACTTTCHPQLAARAAPRPRSTATSRCRCPGALRAWSATAC